MTESQPPSNILVVSDNTTDAAMVRKLLSATFEHVQVSTDPDKTVADFEQWMPEVVVMAFDSLEKAERYYLGLYRFSGKIHTQPHRTVILCDKEDVVRVSNLCMKRYFDDYVLFWPLNHDAPRLPMSVHHALRELAELKQGVPTVAEFAAQARRLAELERLLNQQVELGGKHIDSATLAIGDAENGLDVALGLLTRRLADSAVQEVETPVRIRAMEGEIARFRREDVSNLFRSASASVQPLKKWGEEIKQSFAEHSNSVQSLGAMADRVVPSVLVVDDDDMHRKLITKILEPEGYEVAVASNGAEAMSYLRTSTPDVILMDVLMPAIDGIETTRRMKSVPHLAKIPIIMMTGKSEGAIVVDSLKAGASDFVVKPFDRAALLTKVAKVVGGP